MDRHIYGGEEILDAGIAGIREGFVILLTLLTFLQHRTFTIISRTRAYSHSFASWTLYYYPVACAFLGEMTQCTPD